MQLGGRERFGAPRGGESCLKGAGGVGTLRVHWSLPILGVTVHQRPGRTQPSQSLGSLGLQHPLPAGPCPSAPLAPAGILWVLAPGHRKAPQGALPSGS